MFVLLGLAGVFEKDAHEVDNYSDEYEDAETECASDEPDVGVVGLGCGGC